MSNPVVKIVKMFDDVEVPKYETEHAAGCDLKAYINNISKIKRLLPQETCAISTGLKIQLPDGFEAQIRPRSGLSLKTSLRVANSPGTIDKDYIGEIKVILQNTSHHQEIEISHGDRIAQLVVAPVVQAKFEIVESLEETKRGEGGFGSTGVK